VDASLRGLTRRVLRPRAQRLLITWRIRDRALVRTTSPRRTRRKAGADVIRRDRLPRLKDAIKLIQQRPRSKARRRFSRLVCRWRPRTRPSAGWDLDDYCPGDSLVAVAIDARLGSLEEDAVAGGERQRGVILEANVEFTFKQVKEHFSLSSD
jgi:hypothetical protein